MHILCPVDTVPEVKELARLGAREFYGGFVSPEWVRRFTFAASANRRSFPEAQISDEGTFRALVDTVHDAGATFALTVNSPFYSAGQMGPLLATIDMALGAGVDALIAADIGLILEARSRWPALPVHLSSLAEVSNSPAAAFYRRLGIDRITLPRHLSLAEIEALVRGGGETRFDTFVLYGQCANAEGLCTFSHDHPRRTWPCVQFYRIGQAAPAAPGEGTAPAQCGQMLWGGLNRGEACGLCALYDLDRLGIEGLKIVGRGTSPARKRWAVGAVADLLQLLRPGDPGRDAFCAEARRIYRDRFSGGCRPTLCYFPEFLEKGG